MSKLKLFICLLCLVAGLAAISLAMLVTTVAGHVWAAPAQDTVVRCDPEVVVADMGEKVSFTIFVENVVDLYAGDVQMSFDPTIAQVIDADPNKGGIQIEILDDLLSPDFVVRDRADNVVGTIWYANTQINPSEPVSGSGPLARVAMQSLGPGSFTLAITSQELAKSDGGTILASARDCRIVFFDPNATSYAYMPVTVSP